MVAIPSKIRTASKPGVPENTHCPRESQNLRPRTYSLSHDPSQSTSSWSLEPSHQNKSPMVQTLHAPYMTLHPQSTHSPYLLHGSSCSGMVHVILIVTLL
eukprot:2762485-Amphidinium_carterae.2